MVEMNGSESGGDPPGKPEVTVVVPCYMQAHYLEECLESIRAQTYPNWNAIVVDDASTDFNAVPPILEKLGDERIRVVRHDKNRGLAGSRNTGFRESSTEFVITIDADDMFVPEALESMSDALASDDKWDCAYPNVRLFGRQTGDVEFHGPPRGKKLVRSEDTIPGAGTMMRRRLWQRIGGFDESDVLRAGREDIEFYIRAFDAGCRALHVPKPLYLYRQSHSSMNIACRLLDDRVFQYIHDKNFQVFTLAESQRFLSHGCHQAALASFQRRQRGRAIKLAWQAFYLTPNRGRLRTLRNALQGTRVTQYLEAGELRKKIPFLGYPLRGRQRYRPFFITGVGRSGNTLFRRILTSHSELHIPPETFVLGRCMKVFRQQGSRMNWLDLVQMVMAQFEFHLEFHTFNMSLAPLVNRLSSANRHQRNLAFLFDSFFRYHAEQSGKDPVRWGDKSPLNSVEPDTLEGLLETFPDAQFLNIYRDACDVIYSHLSGGFYRDIRDAAKRWLEVTRRTRRFMARNPSQCYDVRYEDLVSDQETTVRGVCEFMGHAFEPRMLVSERAAEQLGDVPEWYWHKDVTKPVHTTNIGKGRRFFSQANKQILQEMIGDELERLGYPPATTPLEELSRREPSVGGKQPAAG
jgi:glycosyltransferase involved in cell wall biosynthesis